MNKAIISIIVFSTFFSLISVSGAGGLNDVEKWFILLDYGSLGSDINPYDILEYDMAIVDPDNHFPIEFLKDQIILIAYVSLGEAEIYRKYWEKIKNEEWVLGDNPDWKGNFYVDVRSKEWMDIIIDEVIPPIIEQGFKGIFMDTLDTSIMLEDEDPEKYEGVNDAMVELVKGIHEKYPDLYLISNNGFAILGTVSPYLSGALAEDIYTMPDFDNGGYKDEQQYIYRR